MRSKRGLLLTGATGLLGRYLLRDLLAAGCDVAVLARDHRNATAQQRIDELVAFGSESLGRSLPRPIVLAGDLRADALGLGAAERRWLSRWCRSVLHAGAHVGFTATLDGEPWQTNFEGTRRLLELCEDCDLDDFHHVSTAFVCGKPTGPVRESELECGQAFHNEYESSKFETERLLRRMASAGRMCVTVYRPSAIVGDSCTGYTSSYHGFYHLLAMGDRLAETAEGSRRRLDLRVPFSGEETHDLVPVDWVAEAIARLLRQPRCHGRTYHLTAPTPVPGRLIRDVAEEVLAIDGVYWVGPDGLDNPSPVEEHFVELVREYWPYCDGSPAFDRANMAAALPDLAFPCLDGEVFARLIRFAAADRWGRSRRAVGQAAGLPYSWQASGLPHGEFDSAPRYVEEFFPQAVQRSTLAAVPLDIVVGLEVSGAGGGRWTARWADGVLLELRRSRSSREPAEVVFRLDPATCAAIVMGRLTPEEAFFARRVEIEGDVEKGLKLAALFGRLVRECPYGFPPWEVADARSACV